MDRTQATSQEKLDQMLASGAVTAEDHERLAAAMRQSDSGRDDVSGTAPTGSPALPPDDRPAADGRWRAGLAGPFAGLMFLVLYVVPLGMSLFVVPHFIAIFTQLGAELPLLSIWTIRFFDSLGHDPVWAVLCFGLAVLATAVLTAIYLGLAGRAMRAVYALCCLGLGVLWMAFLIAGLYLPLFGLGKAIR